MGNKAYMVFSLVINISVVFALLVGTGAIGAGDGKASCEDGEILNGKNECVNIERSDLQNRLEELEDVLRVDRENNAGSVPIDLGFVLEQGNSAEGNGINLSGSDIVEAGWVNGSDVGSERVDTTNITAASIDETGDNIEVVQSVRDLPDPSGGEIQLADSTVYYFKGFTVSPYTLSLGNATTLMGSHGANDGYIYTGGGVAIKSRNAGFFARDMYFGAPGGTMFDLKASNSKEFLVESVSFSDAAGLGNIVNLGTIEGFRVPTFKSTNFEDFNQGLNFTGNPNKIFISSTPFRDVDASGVRVINLDQDLDVDIIDLTNNYFKDVQPDTKVLHVEGKLPDEILQYRGTTHDASVNASNIISGNATDASNGVKVSDSYPIEDSSTHALLVDNTSTVVAGSGTALTKVVANATLYRSERVRSNDTNLIYDSRFESRKDVSFTVTLTGANTDEIMVTSALNGDTTERAVAYGSLFNSNSKTTVSFSDVYELKEGDIIEVYVQNIDGSADLTVTGINIVM